MDYNVAYEIAALAFLIVLIFLYCAKGRFWDVSDKLYGGYLVVVFVDLVTDILSVYLNENIYVLPLWTNHLANALYLCMQAVLPAVLFFYIVSMIRFRWTWYYRICILPAAVCALLALTSPLTELVYYFDNRAYLHGPVFPFLYLNGLLYIVFCMVLLIRNCKALGRRLFGILLLLVFTNTAAMAIQYFMPEHLIIGVAYVISLLLIYTCLQNPDAYLDPLTTVLNRKAFNSRLEEYQRKNKSYHLAILSLNNFKVVNEIFGVQNGDLILQELALYLRVRFAPAEVYRINGDIFAVMTDRQGERNDICHTLQAKFKNPWIINKDISIVLSVGICAIDSCLYKEDKNSALQLIDYAVGAMKKMKLRDTFFVDETASNQLFRRAQIEMEVARAVEKKAFQVYYQPIRQPSEDRIVSAEALVRLFSPELGMIPPDEFIPIAEQNGSIIEIGYQVLEEVCRFTKEDKLIEKGIQSISVNISPVQYMQDHFSEKVLRLLEKYEIPKDFIILELTETATSLLEKMFLENMQELRSVGLRFALDDYGTGYSTIQYMTILPFFCVKLDKSIIWGAWESAKSRIVLARTVEMLKAIHLKIVAEGIETEKQAEMVEAMGVDYLQGYYYSRPIPGDEFLEKILQKDSK